LGGRGQLIHGVWGWVVVIFIATRDCYGQKNDQEVFWEVYDFQKVGFHGVGV
jgi:hypothetical protein